MSGGKWLPDPWGVAELRWQSRAGDWSDWVSEGGEVREEPPSGDSPAVPTSEACRRCGGSGVAWYRDRLLFWLCVILFWPAAFFVPKKPCCTRCRDERWDAVSGQATQPNVRNGCLVGVGVVIAVVVVLAAISLVVGLSA